MMEGRQTEAREILATNERFYRAFSGRDMEEMERLWAHDAAVACIHPGWSALRGREPVLASWRSILAGDSVPAITCVNATAHVMGEAAYVVCEERIDDTTLIATNVFVREQGAWKLVHHHAGQLAMRVAAPPPTPRAGGTPLN